MPHLLEVRNITKRFGGLVAVNDVSMGVDAGEVVGLLGDNGAGKSTLIKVISGVYRADEGAIFFQDKEVRITSPMDALALGIETIYQDLALAENLNTPANIFLGREKTKKVLGVLNVLDHAYMQAESRKVLEKLDIAIPSLRNRIRALSGGQRQAVAICRSIYWNAKFLIMDEPTAALGVTQTANVLELVRRIADRGHAVIMVSHNLNDVFQVADRVAVLHLGRMVAVQPIAELDRQIVVDLMTSGASTRAAPADHGGMSDGQDRRADADPAG
jgi:ABC-type sugar transport system ATPase subunit